MKMNGEEWLGDGCVSVWWCWLWKVGRWWSGVAIVVAEGGDGRRELAVLLLAGRWWWWCEREERLWVCSFLFLFNVFRKREKRVLGYYWVGSCSSEWDESEDKKTWRGRHVEEGGNFWMGVVERLLGELCGPREWIPACIFLKGSNVQPILFIFWNLEIIVFLAIKKIRINSSK